MDTVVMFLCVCAATVLTQGLCLFLVARYFLKGLEQHGKLEYERLMEIQNKGAEALNRLTSGLAQPRPPAPPKTRPGSGFGEGGGNA